MLNTKQVQYLCDEAGIKVTKHDGLITGLIETRNDMIKVPFEWFKDGMGLDDLRFSWLLGRNNCMAGGAVLAWIMNDPNEGGDYDFFFTNNEAAESFKLFVSQYGFVETKSTGYATTMFHPEDHAIIQVVGDYYNARFFGKVDTILNTFDLTVCMFGVTADNVHFHSRAAVDLITRNVNLYQVTDSKITTSRVTKYCGKGFYVSNNLITLTPWPVPGSDNIPF